MRAQLNKVFFGSKTQSIGDMDYSRDVTNIKLYINDSFGLNVCLVGKSLYVSIYQRLVLVKHVTNNSPYYQ
jgi:hypothetical protein